MHHEETSFIYNAKFGLPDEVMSHDEYISRRNAAVNDMVGERLASKGRLRLSKQVDYNFLGDGIPPHQREDIMLRQFERYAADRFTGQFDEQCNTCPHCKVEVRIDRNNMSREVNMEADCHCEAVKIVGAQCFDGYVPASRQWVWQTDLTPIHASFEERKDKNTGADLLTLHITHDKPHVSFSDDPRTVIRHYGMADGSSVHDEPEGIMTRNNADSGYLTRGELELANEALKRANKIRRANMPTPRPATPTDDAW